MNGGAPTARINMPELLERIENDRELLQELVLIFTREFPRNLTALRQAVAKGDLPEVVVLSHALKGMLLNLSITAAGSRAAEIEQMARTGKVAQLGEAFRAFEGEVGGLLPEVQAQVAEVQR